MTPKRITLSNGVAFEVKEMNDVDEDYFEVYDVDNFLYRIYKRHIMWIHYRKKR